MLKQLPLEDIVELVQMSVNEMLQSVDSRRLAFFSKNMTKFVNDIWLESKNNSYESFKASIKNYKENVGEEAIPFISDVLNRDIYLFKDGKLKTEFIPKFRKSILVEKLSESQFATIGKRSFSSDIEWYFEPDNSLIRKINPNQPLVRSPMTTERPQFKRKELPSLSQPSEEYENSSDEESDHEEREEREDRDREDRNRRDEEQTFEKDSEKKEHEEVDKKDKFENENQTKNDFEN